MKKSQSFLAVSFVSLLFVVLPATAKAALWDVPVGPGETFRWVFVTSLTIDATSSNIDTYNDFVNDVADTKDTEIYTPITGMAGVLDSIGDIEWKAIASTGGLLATNPLSAKDNIGSSPADIYNIDGDLVASGTDDLFSGNINFHIKYDEYGILAASRVFTGSNEFGEIWFPLGVPAPSTVTVGDPQSSSLSWIRHDQISPYGQYELVKRGLYAISEELTVVPVPSALILGATGLLSSTLGLIRLRRKHQEPSQI